MTSRIFAGSACIIAVAGLAASASADISNEVFTISAGEGADAGSWTWTVDDGWYDDDGTYYWDLGGPVDLVGPTGVNYGSLGNASVIYVADPVVSLNFNVQAGSADTAFTISSGLLSFATLDPAEGQASAGVTISDVNGNGASLTPGANGAYRAHYNGLVPAGTVFAELLNTGFSAPSFSSNTQSEDFPGGGFLPIGDPVSSMSSQFEFTLSAFDVASGTSTYVVLPAPGASALIGIAGLMAIRRRR